MAIEVISEQNEGHRINHPVYLDVYNVTYTKAIITDFEMVEDTWDLTDRCKIDMSGHDDEWLPIFYHCKLHCYDDNITSLRDGGALNGGAMAFQVGDEVKILLEENKPKYIIGHYNSESRMCVDIFKLEFPAWDGGTYFLYYQGSAQDEYGELNIEVEDYYGNTPICDQNGLRLFGQNYFLKGYNQIFWGDFYIKVGPVFYIIRIQSVGHPLVVTGAIETFKAVWTQELEDECVRLGAEAEKTIQSGVFGFMYPTWPVYPATVKKINALAAKIAERFSGNIYKLPWPVWWSAKLYGQSYYEE